MTWYYAILLVLGGFLFMEFMAWFTHKYVMHGFLWVLHKDHHVRDGRKIEWNDVFAIVFAAPSIILIMIGAASLDYRFFLGLGIAVYGFSYFLFHDILVHQRVKIFGKMQNRYLKATIKAHLDHHTPHSHKNYGFLVAPWKYYREEFFSKKGN